MHDTVLSRLWAHARNRPSGVAATFLADGEREEHSQSYAQLVEAAAGIGRFIRSRQLNGALIAIALPSGLGFLQALIGCMCGGAIPVPIAVPRLGAESKGVERLCRIVSDCGAKLLIAEGSMVDALREVARTRDDLSSVEIVAMSAASIDGIPREEDFAPNPEAIAFLQYTSGSTANPRGVVVRHRNLVANFAVLEKSMQIDDSTRFLSWLPLHHDMGLIGIVIQALFRGCALVLMSPFHFMQRPMRWLEAISRFQATLSGGPNFAYDLCVDRIGRRSAEPLDLSCWKVAFNGSEPVRAVTMESFSRAFTPSGFRPDSFFPCYGLAEATLYVSGEGYRAATITSFDAPALSLGSGVEPQVGNKHIRLVSAGTPGQDHEVVVADPATCAIQVDGAVGEILVRGPSVTDGYWRPTSESRQTFDAEIQGRTDKYLRTGDLGFLRHGRVFVTGRLKDLIIVRGRNIYPQDVESSAGVEFDQERSGLAAAFSERTHDGEESLTVVREVRARDVHELQKLAARIAERVLIDHDIRARRVVLVRIGSLPRTSSGKIRRSETRRALAVGQILPIVDWGLHAMRAGY